jgi:methyl-accepting chemotaxis protein
MKPQKFLTFILQALGPVLVVSLTGVTHLDFLVTAIKGNTFLNSMIIFVGCAGATLFVLRLFDLNRERVAVRRFTEEVKAGAKMSELMEADWLAKAGVSRYLDHIAQTDGKLNSALDQAAMEGELENLHSEFESKMELPGFLVGFMIAMGLLGTFIGLLETLTGISGMLDGLSGGGSGDIDKEFLKLVGELKKPLAGMGIAFSASMFGLIGSLVLGAMQLAVRRYSKVVMSDAHAVQHELIERVRGPIIAGGPAAAQAAAQSAATRGGVSEAFLSDFMGELVRNMNDMQDLFHRSQDAALSVSNRVDALARKLDDLSQSIENNVEAVKRTNDLLGFGPRMKETNEEVLGEIRSLLANGLERQKAMVRVVDTLSSIDQKLTAGNDGSRNYYDLTGNISTQSLAKLDESVGLLHSVNDRTADSEAKLDRRLQALTTATTNIGTALAQLTTKLSEVASIGQNQLNTSGSAQTMFRDASGEVQSLLGQLAEKIQKLQEVQIGGTRHLWEIKENFGNMGTSLESLKALSQNVGRQTSLLEATLEELRNSQRNMARELRTEFREVARDTAT